MLKIDKKNKEIIVPIPLNKTASKIRIKQRDNIYGYGLSFASKKHKLNQKNYVEWKISYDAKKPKKTNYKKEKFRNYYNTTLKNLHFKGYNDKIKSLYELSEYLYYLLNFKLISIDELKELKSFIENFNTNQLIEKHSHCAVKRKPPNIENINGIDFEILKVEYPQLVHKFKKYEIITEINIREKQKAVLYFCFPVTELISDQPLIGRTAKAKETAHFKINKDNSFIILEITKIFGMLSESHKFDILKIIDLIIEA